MKFDVFVSFRGIDTRRTFVSHLLLSLFKEGFRTFKQEAEEAPCNEPASSQALQAIENSKIAVVVISNNYTCSISCLDELAKITECMENRSLMMIIPVLYEVEPSDVLRQADNLEKLSDGDIINLKMVERWRNALARLVELHLQVYTACEVKDSYAYDISIVMDLVSKRLRREPEPIPCQALEGFVPYGFVTEGIRRLRAAFGVKPATARSSGYTHKKKYVTGNEFSQFVPSSDFNSLVGLNRQLKAVETLLLDLDSYHGVGEIGICGVEGIGKTTLARCVYEQISPQFQDHCYFVRDKEKNSIGLEPTCLLEEITRAALTSEGSDEVVNHHLGHRKVLLMVDEVNGSRTLKSIRKFSRWFGPGSRLIFVTEYNYWLLHSEVKHIYEVEPLRYDEALQLFSLFAFKQTQVPREYYRLSVRAVLITGRIPLALKVFGSFLRGKTISEWEFELCRLEASQDNFVARVSSYIVNALS